MNDSRPACRRILPIILILAALPLSGCGSLLSSGTSTAAGVAGAGIASAVSKNAVVGAGIGLGVAAAADAGLQYAERNQHQAEQDRIAEVVGTLPDGESGIWSISHSIPIEDDEHGALFVTRVFTAHPASGAGFTCKEFVFSVDSGEGAALKRAFYTATACQDGTIWKWASAEPATERWGSLQ